MLQLKTLHLKSHNNCGINRNKYSVKSKVSLEKQHSYCSPDNDSLSPKIALLDIERENRLSKVISLFSKGLNQAMIITMCFTTNLLSQHFIWELFVKVQLQVSATKMLGRAMGTMVQISNQIYQS